MTTKSKKKKKSHVQVIEKERERRKGIERTTRELLNALYDCLWNVVHGDCMNRGKKEVAQSNRCTNVKGIGITRDYYKSQMENSEITNYGQQALKQKSPETSSKVRLLYYTCTLSLRSAKHLFCFPLI